MFRALIIGNLGADARVEQSNGRPFISFNVAHNDRYEKEDGTVVEKQQWISCAMNGDGGKLLQYLKKGRQVYVEGRCSTRVFSSEKERRMVAGVNLSVDHLELIGGQADEIPGRIFDTEGVMHDTHKAYWIDPQEAAAILKGSDTATMYTQSGAQVILKAPHWVALAQQVQPQQPVEEQVEVFDGKENDEQARMLQEKMSKAKSKKA